MLKSTEEGGELSPVVQLAPALCRTWGGGTVSRLFLAAKLQHPGSGIKFYVYQDVYHNVYQDMYHNLYHYLYNHVYNHVYHPPHNPLILRPLRRPLDMHCMVAPYILP